MENYSSNSRQADTEGQIQIREILEFFWRLRWWIIASMILAGIAGFFYIRMQTPVYQRQSWIMLNKNDGSNADLALLATMTGRTVQKRVDNEIFILKSPSLMQKVVEQNELNKRYFQYGAPVGNRLGFMRAFLNFKKTEFYKNSPFEATMQLDSLSTTLPSVYIEFKNNKGDSFTI